LWIAHVVFSSPLDEAVSDFRLGITFFFPRHFSLYLSIVLVFFREPGPVPSLAPVHCRLDPPAGPSQHDALADFRSCTKKVPISFRKLLRASFPPGMHVPPCPVLRSMVSFVFRVLTPAGLVF